MMKMNVCLLEFSKDKADKLHIANIFKLFNLTKCLKY